MTATGAECLANGVLLGATVGANQEEIDEVNTSDEQQGEQGDPE